MSPERRQALKQAIDALVRQREGHATQRTHCRGCGCDLAFYTPGCKPCRNRKSARKVRAAA